MGQRSDQIQSRIKENPNRIDEVPVDDRRFHCPMLLLGIAIADQIPQHNGQEDDTGQHMKGMKTSHRIKNGSLGAIAGAKGGNAPLDS